MDDILFETRGALGLVTLNRPKAMNALTHVMALSLEARLADWAHDDGIAVVAIRGAGERAFCAGGDIRALYEAGRPGGARGAANFAFYADEYRLNAAIRGYPKPYVALMDGVVMGGGVGLSVHATRRVAGEATLFAMPETGIGLFPDVGSTWFLPRLPGETGMWLGLTGARLGPRDALDAGVCDVFVPSAGHADLVETLAGLDTGAPIEAVDRVLATFARPPGGAGLVAAQRPLIDRCFAAGSVEAVLSALSIETDAWSAAQHAEILAKSPTSTRLAFRQIRAGAGLDFAACMALEYRLARFCMTRPDFYEGVRALIVDKDNAPRWDPASLAAADEAFVAPAFAALPPGEDLHL